PSLQERSDWVRRKGEGLVLSVGVSSSATDCADFSREPSSGPSGHLLPSGQGLKRSGPLAPGFWLRRGGARDQSALPAGRRQELAGLLLARAVFGRLGGAAACLEDGFVVEE